MATETGENKYNKYGQPALDFIFTGTKKSLKDRSGNRQLQFTRDSIGTYVDENGIIQTAASGEARFDHDPATGESLGLLVEEEGTNLVVNSTSVTATGGTVTLNGGSSPDGGTSSILLTANQAGGYVQGNSGFGVSTVTDHTISFWYKDGTGTATSIRIEGVLNGGGKGYFAFLDLNDGTNVSKYSTHTNSYGIQMFPNGWKRFYMGYNSTSGTNATGSFVFRIRINGIQDTQTCYLFGLQAETGFSPTSYIPTSGSTVTRSADVASLTNSNIYDTDSFTILNEPFGSAAGSSTLSLVGAGETPIKRTAVYRQNLTQTQINANVGKTDEFWRWRILGSSFGLPDFATDGQVTVDWGDGTVETLTTSDHTFTDGGGYHDIGFRLDSGTYFQPRINNNANHDTKLVAVGPAPESMKVDLTSIFYGASNLVSIDSTISLSSASNQKLRESICSDCSSLKSFPYIDFSGASSSSIRYAWRNCTSMESFPLLDLSQAWNLGDGGGRGAWNNCSALKSFPAIHFPNVLNAFTAWGGCSSMTEFKATGFGLCTTFYATWSGCSSLTSFPLIDTSSGTNFTFAWRDCSSLTSFPEIDTSSGTNFTYAWYGCSSLISFPLIDTSSGTSFSNTWFGCSSLTSFPLLNTSSGTSFASAWSGCSSLTSFPLIDTSSSTNFGNTWFGCSSLISFPLIDIEAGTTFYRAWINCSSLTTFPANFFDSWTGTPANNCFMQTWDGCSSLTATSVENILNSIDTSGQSAPASGVDITIDYNAGSGTPSIATAVTNLKSRGWTITLNGVAQ
jgi:hypothetical protein